MPLGQTPLPPTHAGNASVNPKTGIVEYLDITPIPTTRAWDRDVLRTPFIPNAESMFIAYPRRIVIKSTVIEDNVAKNWSGGLHLVSENCAFFGVKVRSNVAGGQAGGVLIDNANVLFYSSVIGDNHAKSQGAAMYIANPGSSVQIFAGSNLTTNRPLESGTDGNILYSQGTVTFGTGSMISWNGSGTEALKMDGQAQLWYVLPAPVDSYGNNPFTCKANGPENCDFEVYESLYVSKQENGEIASLSHIYPPLCEAGYYAEGHMYPNDQLKSTCYRECPISHYCPTGTVTPVLCPKGEFTKSTRMRTEKDCRGCNTGFYSSVNEFDGAVSCFPCPKHFTTPGNKGGANSRSCVCNIGFYAHGSECLPCPYGAVCTDLGVTLENMVVEKRYWRPSSHSLPGPCPYRSTCVGGSVASPAYDQYSNETCKEGLRGAFCTKCVDDNYAFDPRVAACSPRSSSQDLLIAVVALLSTIALLPFCLEGWLARVLKLDRRLKRLQTDRFKWAQRRLRSAKNQLRRVIKKVADPVKLCISFYQVIMQMGTVYRTQVPPAYQDLLSFANRVVDWVRGSLHNAAYHCAAAHILCTDPPPLSTSPPHSPPHHLSPQSHWMCAPHPSPWPCSCLTWTCHSK
jgi:hypothetical protein